MVDDTWNHHGMKEACIVSLMMDMVALGFREPDYLKTHFGWDITWKKK